MITSPANPRLRLVRRLASRRQRERLGMFVCEGEDLVAAGVAAGLDPVHVLVDAERRPRLDVDGEPVEPRLLAEVSQLGHPPRVVAIFRRADLPTGPAPPCLALWYVSDPGNVGTLLRTADAFRASLAVSPGSADPTGPKALRASAGAVFRVPVGRFDGAPEPWIALVARGGRPLPELDLSTAATFVLGAERGGLPDDVLARCVERATIPLAGRAESLNVAVAGAIALYELSRRSA